METVRLIECPRDAWQGLTDFIPAEYKAEYLGELVRAGFKHIDAVSFVSPKHVKQMADSEQVMKLFTGALPPNTGSATMTGLLRDRRGTCMRSRSRPLRVRLIDSPESLKTRSIWMGAVLHVSVALSMDFASLWRKGYFS